MSKFMTVTGYVVCGFLLLALPFGCVEYKQRQLDEKGVCTIIEHSSRSYVFGYFVKYSDENGIIYENHINFNDHYVPTVHKFRLIYAVPYKTIHADYYGEPIEFKEEKKK
jgi:hypothetical protein